MVLYCDRTRGAQTRKETYENPENLSTILKRQLGSFARVLEHSRTTDP
jgi:hypothetical protein